MNEYYINDRRIPPCLIGTWAWGSGSNGSQMVFGKKYDAETLKETFHQAVENGFVFWDTAEVYGMGNSEKLLGSLIKDSKEKIIISTKYLPEKKYQNGKMRESLSKSVERLKIEAPDLYWLHNSNNCKENAEEIFQLLKEGKVKSVGLSNFSSKDIIAVSEIAKKNGVKITGIQNHFSLIHYNNEQKKIVKWCQDNNVIYFAYMVLEQGALSGKYDYKNSFPFFSARNFFFGKKKFKQINPLIELIRELGKKYYVSPAQISIAWAISKDVVPIVGLTSPSHVKGLVEGVNVRLSTDDINQLEKTAEETHLEFKTSWEP